MAPLSSSSRGEMLAAVLQVPPRSQFRRLARLAGLLVAAAVLGALPGLVPSRLSAHPTRLDAEEAPRDEAIREALHEALEQVDHLQQEVDSGRIVDKFGEKARDIVERAGQVAPELEAVVDGAMQALFIRQLTLLRGFLLSKFERGSRPAKALARADKDFLARAAKLVRPGSDWSFEEEREAFIADLEQAFDMRAELVRERSRAAQTQRATADVVGRMQKQMDLMGEKLRGMGAGSPWVLWTSYRLPGTPYQISGRYQEGRANIELNLSPAGDPATAEAGFVEGLTPRNLGLSFNVGV